MTSVIVSFELPVATKHHRDMTEKLLKATLNSNKQQQHDLSNVDWAVKPQDKETNEAFYEDVSWKRKTTLTVLIFELSALSEHLCLGHNARTI